MLYMVYITPESTYITSGGVYADSGAVIIFELMKSYMPESS